MFLRSLAIKNYRSLEEVQLEKLGCFNVLIGRNNAGKSSVFEALAHLAQVMVEEPENDSHTMLTDQDTTRSLEICLVFELSVQERKEFFDRLYTGGRQQERLQEMLDSSLAQRVEYSFKAVPGSPGNLYPSETRLLAEDDDWSVVQQVDREDGSSTPPSTYVKITSVSDSHPYEPLGSGWLNIEDPTHTAGIQRTYLTQAYGSQFRDTAMAWLSHQCPKYFRDAFFFSPFRHSNERAPVRSVAGLDQDGSNLAQVLNTISNDDLSKFHEIERFVQAALPYIGELHTPFKDAADSTTRNAAPNIGVGFRVPGGNYSVPLHDMGGGVEQLLMVATVLLTTDDSNSMFLEEPESHLHAGAQRFLVERLNEGDRQIFVTTHSPTFINVSAPRSLYQVAYDANRTKVTRVEDADALGIVLEDIGNRNSDVLLSDAVLFVEGESDQRALNIWSETLGMSLTERNVTLLTMGGGEHADRHAPIRSDLLAGISQRAPIPHLFVLDRDQRSLVDISILEQKLEGRIHILSRRELENYLLIPRALREALQNKCRTDYGVLQKLNETSDEDIQRLIQESADGLYRRVLLKRIRSELGGLQGGLLTREAVDYLAAEADYANLPKRVYQAVVAQVSPHLIEPDVKRLVLEQKEALDTEWSERDQRRFIAAGEEIVDAVFRSFGVRYRKLHDTIRIAEQMSADDISSEIKDLIVRAASLPSTP